EVVRQYVGSDAHARGGGTGVKYDGGNGRKLYRLCNATVPASMKDFNAAQKRSRRERTHVQDMPKSIARVNAFFAGGIASSSASASPRGQRRNIVSVAKIRVSPCVNAMPA